MTQSHENIIAEYRDADFNRRLHMYLQFPPFRSSFMAIDQSELNDQQCRHAARRRASLTALLSVLFNATAGFVRRLS
jgi:hypothetical protein